MPLWPSQKPPKLGIYLTGQCFSVQIKETVNTVVVMPQKICKDPFEMLFRVFHWVRFRFGDKFLCSNF